MLSSRLLFHFFTPTIVFAISMHACHDHIHHCHHHYHYHCCAYQMGENPDLMKKLPVIKIKSHCSYKTINNINCPSN